MAIELKRTFMNWSPIQHEYIRDEGLKQEIHNNGYKVVDWLNSDIIDQLKSIFESEHELNVKDGGMFYSLYSKDLEYRKRIHERIAQVLQPILDDHFIEFKNVINSFVVKLPGEKSEFYLHQDTTGLDEFKFSPLSLWIPLQDVNENNGTLALVEKTHWFFSPFRGVSFSFPFKKINHIVQKYLRPISMKKGEALCFDNRIVHNSLANNSSEPRIAIVCGLFQVEATFQTCYQKNESAPIEIYEHNDQFMLEYPHFFYNCTDRPSSGKKIKEIQTQFPSMNEDEFVELCTMNNIESVNKLSSTQVSTANCQMIAEPDGINKFEDFNDK